MRVSFAMTYSNSTQNLDQDKTDISKLSAQVSSGTRLQSPTDDPWAWSQAFNMNQNLREYQSFQSNIQYAQGWGQATESALSQMSDLLVKAKQIAIGSISANSQQSLAAQADSMNQILQQAKGLIDTQYDNSDLFPRSTTNPSQEPFTFDSTSETYYNPQGTQPQNQVRVAKDPNDPSSSYSRDTVNVGGESAFCFTDPNSGNPTNVLTVLYQAQKAIASGNTTDISNTMTSIDTATNQVANSQALVGTRLDKLQTQLSSLQTTTTNQKAALSTTQDTDMASAITQLQQKQTIFQAALQVTAMVGKLSLTQYL